MFLPRSVRHRPSDSGSASRNSSAAKPHHKHASALALSSPKFATPDPPSASVKPNPNVGSSTSKSNSKVAPSQETLLSLETFPPFNVSRVTSSTLSVSSSNPTLQQTGPHSVSANYGPSTAFTHPEDDDEGEPPVKLRRSQQRASEPGEPSCVVCGRYGEYICDVTDDDVCSVECKAFVLGQVRIAAPKPNLEEGKKSVTQTTPDGAKNWRSSAVYFRDHLPFMRDDSEIVVKDGEKGLNEWEPDKAVRKLTIQQVDILRSQAGISLEGEDVPFPIMGFEDCKFPPRLQANLESMGYETPTPVQMQVIPAALKKRDMLVSAGTGSGKTAGYLLFVVSRCCLILSHYQLDARKPLAIVLAPTRELCEQVEQQAKILAKGLPFKTALVVGGDAMPRQLYRIGGGVELIVATPGRLVDLLGRHDVELDNVCIFVIDEVDCMLERGFRDKVLQIQTALTQPQILMFSATIPPDIEKLSTAMMNRPVCVSVGPSNSPSEAVKQTVIWVETNQKKKKLFDIIKSPNHFHPPVVVFVNSRVGAELLAESITSTTGLHAAAVHGEKPMSERRQVLKDFLMGDVPVIVATGVLGRGLDLMRVTQVIVFDMPLSTEEYIHQIGRASKVGGPQGSAMVFINEDSKMLFKDLIALFRNGGVVVPKELLNSPYAASSYAVAYNTKKRKSHREDRSR